MATANALKQTTDLINNIFEEDENNDRKVDGRSQPRPGKSNLHGRKDNCNSTWGRMLLDDKDQLMKFDSAEAKLFRIRFRHKVVKRHE